MRVRCSPVRWPSWYNDKPARVRRCWSAVPNGVDCEVVLMLQITYVMIVLHTFGAVSRWGTVVEFAANWLSPVVFVVLGSGQQQSAARNPL